MGRTNYSQVGHGFTESEARKNAYEDARDEFGHQEGYSGSMASATGERDEVKCIQKPKLAKTCKVKKPVQKGARKWETVFVIEATWGFSGNNYPMGKTIKGTQAQAIKEAKRMALENQTEYSIRIKKQLIQGVEEIAVITPNKSVAGKWLFTGLARE